MEWDPAIADMCRQADETDRLNGVRTDEDAAFAGRRRLGSFPCPACRSLLTSSGKSPIGAIDDTDGRPNYVRRRSCERCGAVWQTVESIVVGSVRTRDGRVVC